MLVIAHPSALADAGQLAKALSRFGRAKVEDGRVMLETGTPQQVAGTFGVAKVSIVIECENQLGAIARAIAEVGRKAILPGQSFCVKAYMAQERGFTVRDVEFAATGVLAEELAGAAKPAGEHEAQKTVSAYVGRRSFVAVKEYEGAGGAVSGSQGTASCALIGPQSLAACLAAAKVGFSLELVLIYSNEDDLRKNAKLASVVAERTGAEKQELAVARLQSTRSDMLAFDWAAAKALARTKSRYAVLSVSLATHPKWFIEAVMKEAQDAGKVPLAPLMFLDPEQGWQDARKLVRRKLGATLSNPKRVRLEVGPDYLHDIVDSV